MSALLVAGTTSDAGKTVLVTGICRSLARRGMTVAPFKAQNMSNNSMVTAEGAEIGRAQWIQAVAARATPEAAMNPVLLKPGSDRRSHVVVLGQPAGTLEAGEFAGGRKHLAEAAFGAFDELRSRFDVVICEGAGSAAEINLRAHDYVNMGLAQHGSIPTVVVGDIDRGGVFASMYGTLALLDAADQQLVRGFVINKFRGDAALLEPGVDALEKLTGRRVFGVLPWQRDLWLDSEDSLALTSRPAHDGDGALTIAVVMLPRISNFTDVDALCLEPDVRVRFVDDPRSLAGADVVIVPGTRATLADLDWMHTRGLDTAIVDHARRGGPVLGICGGFQILGSRIDDPHGVEGPPGRSIEGLGVLPARTVFGPDKVLRLPTGAALGAEASGYEIHHGRVTVEGGSAFLDGVRDGNVFGTMWHGALEGDEFRAAWLRDVAAAVGREISTGSVSFSQARDAQIETLADLVDECLDTDALLDTLSDTAVLPTLTGALR